jgi:putative FmdB family regulatory protein
MPIYEYECSAHGLFEAERSMMHSAQPAPCPECQASARRVLSATRTALVPRAGKLARERNERSQHQPELRRAQSAGACARGPRLQASHGRPWCLEHG